MLNSPSPTKMLLVSPHLQSRGSTKLSPLLNYARNSPQLKPTELDSKRISTFKKATEKLLGTDKTQFSLEKESKKEDVKKEESKKEGKKEEKKQQDTFQSSKRTPWIDTTNAKDIILSPSMNPVSVHLQPPSTPSFHGVLTYCSCGQLCQKGSQQCAKCSLKSKVQIHSGYCYEINSVDGEQMNRYWFSLMGKELYSNIKNKAII